MNFSNNVNSISYEYRYPNSFAYSQGFGIDGFWGPFTFTVDGGWQYRRWETWLLISGPAGTLSTSFHVYNNNTLFVNITGTTNDYNSLNFVINANFSFTSLSINTGG